MKERNNKYRCTFALDDEHHQGERQEAARGPATMSDDGTSDDEEAHDDLAGDWHFGGHLGVDVEDDDEEERAAKEEVASERLQEHRLERQFHSRP